MTLGRFTRGVLFCAGMISGATAGNLFYIERLIAGFAMLALTAVFLFFAMSDLTYHRGNNDEYLAKTLADQQLELTTLGLLLADSAVDGLKRVGRTMPCTPTELKKFEDDIMPFLNSLEVPRKERERISQEINKLRTRSRQDDGRRALSGNR